MFLCISYCVSAVSLVVASRRAKRMSSASDAPGCELLSEDVDEGGSSAIVPVETKRRKVSEELLPNGPETFEDIFDWAERLLHHITDLRLAWAMPVREFFAKLGTMTVVVTTAFSGVGTPEIACWFIQEAFRKQGFPAPPPTRASERNLLPASHS